jgi:hypothetical protein
MAGTRQRSVSAYVINNMFPPPGLLDVSQYIETSSGGDEAWLAFTSKKLYTNAFIVSPGPPRKVASVMKLVANCFSHPDSQILLGYKKRGFGANL